MRRGATTEALNAGITGPTVDDNSGWRNVKVAKGKMTRYSMHQRYIQVFQDLKHQLMFSLGVYGRPRGGVIISVQQYWHVF
jgi:hypothetical protein